MKFEVSTDYLLRAPWCVESMKVNFRGMMDGKAVVYDKGTGAQFCVDPAHLSEMPPALPPSTPPPGAGAEGEGETP